MLGRRVDQEGITLGREIEMLGEVTVVQEMSVILHLKQIVITFPDERYSLELIDTIAFLMDASHARSSGCQQIGIDQLFPPFYDTFDHVQA